MPYESIFETEHTRVALASADTLKVLVVDDDDIDLLNVQRLLRQIFGDRAQVEFARKWDDAFRLMSEATHDIYFVDYSLGARTGLELIDLVTDEANPRIFILMTGQNNPAVDQAASRAGVVDYLIKGELSVDRLERCLRYATEAVRQTKALIAQSNELRKAKADIESTLSRAKKSEAQYRWLAQHDLLTQMPNRALFAEKLQSAVDHGSRSDHHLALLLLDLDRFKVVNDTLGHQFGDALLVEVAKRLSAAMRTTDTVARLSGDEFAIIITNLDEKRYASVAAQKLIDALAKPFEIRGHRIETGCSIGIAIASPESGITHDELSSMADIALYRAKAAGRGQFHFYNKKLNDEVQRSNLLQKELKLAVSAGMFSLAFQPKIQISNGAITGFEALARWPHPTLGAVPPDEFIPLAESTGLILPLSDWVLEEACQTAVSWRGTALDGVSIAINLSPIQLQQNDFLGRVSSMLARYGLDPAMLQIEITETAALHDLDSAIVQLAELRAFGVKVAIDDFGTGHSSLSLATRLPSDYLKVDRSFVKGMMSNRSDAAAVNATITLAHSMDLAAVAEGVETQEQLAFLQALGCDQAQGYFIAKPQSADNVLAWRDAEAARVSLSAHVADDAYLGARKPLRYGSSTTRQY